MFFKFKKMRYFSTKIEALQQSIRQICPLSPPTKVRLIRELFVIHRFAQRKQEVGHIWTRQENLLVKKEHCAILFEQ